MIPRPIAWITTYNPTQTVINVAPFSFFSVVTGEPPLLSVSILRDQQGEMKDTARNLSQTREAVVHIVSEDAVVPMNQTSASLAAQTTELAIADLATVASQVVAVPGLKLPKIRFEVTVYQILPIQNERGTIKADLFILKVVAMHFSESVLELEKYHVLAQVLKPVARLAGPEYANLGQTYQLKRPD